MHRYAIFQMWGPLREQLIAAHEFYVQEARRRLLNQFAEGEMRAEADRFADAWLENRSAYFDPDRHDPGDNYEQALDERIAFYMRLEDLRNTTRLSIVAGLYHEWEKELRAWLVRELARVAPGRHLETALRREKVGGLIDFLETWRWPVRSRPYFRDLYLCGLVVNVYKHGGGSSLEELARDAPELVGRGPDAAPIVRSILDHSRLSVEDADLERFSQAILAFWKDLPEYVFRDEMAEEPAWLRKAWAKDRAEPAS